MTALQPRSLLLVLLMGCGCLALPLGLGLHRASGLVSTIASEAESLLHQSVDTARRARVLVGLSGDLVRNARQVQVLNDPALSAIYHERHRKLLAELDAIERTNPHAEIIAASAELRQLAKTLHPLVVGASRAKGDLQFNLPRFDALVGKARRLEQLGTQRFDDDLLRLSSTTDAARETLFVQGLALIPITVLVAFGFSAAVMRPIRALVRAIRNLGEGKLSGPVSIPGPREIASLGKELEWLRARLAASEEEKHGFLRRMSHELKTPLASLREGAALLADGSVGEISPRQREVVDIMRESGGRLDAQIHNLLTVTALGATTPEARRERLRVDHVLTQVLRSHKLEVESKRIAVDARMEDVHVNVDPQHLRMALDNVVGNAVKFTPENGRIRVGVRLERTRAVIDVVDSGPGIPRAERHLVFRPFYQGAAAGRTPMRGAGVGLSVVRECLARFGGAVNVLDSKSGAHIQIRLKEARRA